MKLLLDQSLTHKLPDTLSRDFTVCPFEQIHHALSRGPFFVVRHNCSGIFVAPLGNALVCNIFDQAQPNCLRGSSRYYLVGLYTGAALSMSPTYFAVITSQRLHFTLCGPFSEHGSVSGPRLFSAVALACSTDSKGASLCNRAY